jgi:DNA-binding helix-hairpin-helix protein with protein kinase domain
MKLTDSGGNPVALAGRLGAGGEAEIFKTTGPSDLVAKIYHHTSAERAAKLQVMISVPPADPTAVQGHRSICWPTSLLFDHQRIAIGFLMPRVDSAGNLPIFKLYNPQDRQEVAPGFTWQYLMRAAVNVASVISAIHSKGYVVGDLNESNILVSDSALVSLVDCDSMQVPQPGTGMFFRCPVGKPEFTPPELQGCDFARVDRTPEHDNFGLGVLIFQLLMEGTHPFSGIWKGAGDSPPIEERIRHGSSPYAGAKSTQPMPGAPPFDILPVGLQALMIRCFRDGYQAPGARPTPSEWQSALAAAETNLSTCARSQRHVYSAHLAYCPWCERARLLGGLDPFPASSQQRPLRQSRFVTPAPAAQPAITVPAPPSQVTPTVVLSPPPSPPPPVGHNWGRVFVIGISLVLISIAGYRALNSSNQSVVRETVGQPTQSTPGTVSSGVPAKQQLPQADDDVTEALVGAVAEDRNWEIAGLIAKGADPNKAKLQNSPVLVTALSFCGLKTAKALIDGGANVNVRLKKTGQTALVLASACPDSSDLVTLLRAHGAE